jgi:2-haloacid dehalogenase
MIRALCFDVFGTVVDWRSSIIAEGVQFNHRYGWQVDWAKFADAWRGLYQPSMEEVRCGDREWVPLDTLHRESLERLLDESGLSLQEDELDHVNRVWHRLQPWPDSVEGLTRMKSGFTLATLSNGNIELLSDMASHSGLPWDAILGAEPAQQYKPRPEPYLVSAKMLALEPDQCMLVAAHNSDLVTAAKLGFKTAFVTRSTEYGPTQDFDLVAEHGYDHVAADMIELADQLQGQ